MLKFIIKHINHFLAPLDNYLSLIIPQYSNQGSNLARKGTRAMDLAMFSPSSGKQELLIESKL
jgi:hypothetical protein